MRDIAIEVARELDAAVRTMDAQKIKNILKDLSCEEKKRVLDATSSDIFVYGSRISYVITMRLLNAASLERKIELINNAQSLFRLAVRQGRKSMVSLLLREADLETKQALIISVLNDQGVWNAVANGHIAIVELLLREAALELKQDIIKANFKFAVHFRKLAIANLFWRESTPEVRKQLSEAEYTGIALTRYIRENDTEMVEFLLSIATPQQKQDLQARIPIMLERVGATSLPLVLAHADPVLHPVSKYIPNSEEQQNLDKRVSDYRMLIVAGNSLNLSEVIKQNSVLNLVCKQISNILPKLTVDLFCGVCAFLGMPQLQQALVVIPRNSCFKYAQRIEDEQNKQLVPPLNI